MAKGKKKEVNPQTLRVYQMHIKASGKFDEDPIEDMNGGDVLQISIPKNKIADITVQIELSERGGGGGGPISIHS